MMAILRSIIFYFADVLCKSINTTRSLGKKWIFFPFLCICSFAYADTPYDSSLPFPPIPPKSEDTNSPCFYPFAIEGETISVSPARFTTSEFEDLHIRYKQSDISFGFTCPLTTYAGIIFGTSWTGNEVDMQNNPEFHQTHFSYVTFSVGGFTKAYPKWLWTAFMEMSLDTEKLDLGNYALYDMILLGEYTASSNLNFSFGGIFELGLHKERAWPILGFSYGFYPCWMLNAVFPTNLSVEYKLLPALTAASSIRFFRARYRVGIDEPNPLAIFEYQTTGIEIDLAYEPTSFFWIKGYVGHTFSGDFKITNSNNRHGNHFKFEGAFYGGITAEINF